MYVLSKKQIKLNLKEVVIRNFLREGLTVFTLALAVHFYKENLAYRAMMINKLLFLLLNESSKINLFYPRR